VKVTKIQSHPCF